MNDIEILEEYVKLLDDTITKRVIENLLIENKELNYGYDKVYKELEKCKKERQEDKDRIKELEEENGMLRERLEKIEEYIKQCDWHDNDVYIGEDILDLLEESD